MKQELTDFKQYFQAAAAVIPNDSFYFSAIVHKYRHSIDVLRAGQQILSTTPELADVDNNFRTFAERALLFHDVGRFQENEKRYLSEKNHHLIKAVSNYYDHGQIGYEILKDRPPYDDLRILFAVRYHGKMMEEVYASNMWHEIENSPQKDEIEKILYLVRDADKLANLYAMKSRDRLHTDIFYKQLTPQNITGPLSDAVKKQFLTKQIVLLQNLKTQADRILMALSWIFDFNYNQTCQLFLTEEYDVYLLNELATCEVSKAEIDLIKKIIDTYLANH